jgi:hypothetical protein
MLNPNKNDPFDGLMPSLWCVLAVHFSPDDPKIFIEDTNKMSKSQ